LMKASPEAYTTGGSSSAVSSGQEQDGFAEYFVFFTNVLVLVLPIIQIVWDMEAIQLRMKGLLARVGRMEKQRKQLAHRRSSSLTDREKQRSIVWKSARQQHRLSATDSSEENPVAAGEVGDGGGDGGGVGGGTRTRSGEGGDEAIQGPQADLVLADIQPKEEASLADEGVSGDGVERAQARELGVTLGPAALNGVAVTEENGRTLPQAPPRRSLARHTEILVSSEPWMPAKNVVVEPEGPNERAGGPSTASLLANSLTQLAASREVRPGSDYEMPNLESAEASTRGRRAAGDSDKAGGGAVVSV